jgi:peptide chain release factor-like protein
LLGQCEVDTYRASGPGGQKRNKTSSAVRLRHPPTGLIVIAEESRSQHENKAKALRRLRRALYLELRDPLPPNGLAEHPDWHSACNSGGRIALGRRDPKLWPALGIAFDVLEALEARVSETAAALGVSTANLVDLLATDPKAWQQANIIRHRFGQKPLKA